MALISTIKLNLDSSSVKRGVAGMKKDFKEFGKKAALAFAAVGAAGVTYFKKFSREMDRISKLAQRFGEGTTEGLQRVELAAKLAGADLETVAKGVQTITRAVVEADRGSTSYARSLKALGISSEKLLKMSMSEKLLALSEAYSKAQQGGEGMADIMTLMGRSGAELIPLLEQGPGSLAKSFADAKVVGEDVVKQMVEVNDTIAKFENSFRSAFAVGISEADKFVANFDNFFRSLGKKFYEKQQVWLGNQSEEQAQVRMGRHDREYWRKDKENNNRNSDKDSENLAKIANNTEPKNDTREVAGHAGWFALE